MPNSSSPRKVFFFFWSRNFLLAVHRPESKNAIRTVHFMELSSPFTSWSSMHRTILLKIKLIRLTQWTSHNFGQNFSDMDILPHYFLPTFDGRDLLQYYFTHWVLRSEGFKLHFRTWDDNYFVRTAACWGTTGQNISSTTTTIINSFLLVHGYQPTTAGINLLIRKIKLIESIWA